MKRRPMLETHYRASRFCRVLGNPTAYQILKILSRGKKTPSELANEIGLSRRTISDTLRNLRQVDLVRYDTVKKNKLYFLKDYLIKKILVVLEDYADRMRFRKWESVNPRILGLMPLK
ncbi:MAG: ArsR/SmtB family transcription factor [bacterium]